MAALGRFSGVLLRSALTQSRRQLSAAVAGHGEQTGNSSASSFNPPGGRLFVRFDWTRKCFYCNSDLAAPALAG